MSLHLIKQVRQAVHNLNPAEVREQAERPLRIGMVSSTDAGHWRMESHLCPPELSSARRAEVSRLLYRVSPSDRDRAFDIEIWDLALAHPGHAFPFDPGNPERLGNAVLEPRPDLSLPLARHIFPFRRPVIERIIRSVAKENALFSLATALPDIVPLLSLPWALGEFASDTAFLTMNQFRMKFLIAAASGCKIGYR